MKRSISFSSGIISTEPNVVNNSLTKTLILFSSLRDETLLPIISISVILLLFNNA